VTIQPAWDAACQEHSRATPTDTVPTPPPGPNEEIEELTVASQRADVDGLVTLVAVELPQAIAESAHAATAATGIESRRTPARPFTPERNAGKSPVSADEACYNESTPAEQL
jgi:hypothetical protein